MMSGGLELYEKWVREVQSEVAAGRLNGLDAFDNALAIAVWIAQLCLQHEAADFMEARMAVVVKTMRATTIEPSTSIN